MTPFTWCLHYLFIADCVPLKMHFLTRVRSDVKTTVNNAMNVAMCNNNCTQGIKQV